MTMDMYCLRLWSLCHKEPVYEESGQEEIAEYRCKYIIAECPGAGQGKGDIYEDREEDEDAPGHIDLRTETDGVAVRDAKAYQGYRHRIEGEHFRARLYYEGGHQ